MKNCYGINSIYTAFSVSRSKYSQSIAITIYNEDNSARISVTDFGRRESLDTELIPQLLPLIMGSSFEQWVNLPSFVRIDETKDHIMGADPDPV